MEKILFTGARSGIINKVINEIINKDYYIYITVHTFREERILKEKYKEKNVEIFKLNILDEKDLKKLDNLDIDILVCNAAIGESGSVADIDINKIRKNFETNVFSNFNVVQKVINQMIKKKKGKIIMMSSLAGLIPIPFLSSYCATKASIIKLTECLRMELKILKNEIKIKIIEPGLYDTGFNRLMIDKKYDYMDINSYFKNQIKIIKKSENIILKLFEKNNLQSIVKQITKAIQTNNNKFIYTAPKMQRIFSKLYIIFKS